MFEQGLVRLSRLWLTYTHLVGSKRLSASEPDDSASNKVLLQGRREPVGQVPGSLCFATFHYSVNFPESFDGGLHCRSQIV